MIETPIAFLVVTFAFALIGGTVTLMGIVNGLFWLTEFLQAKKKFYEQANKEN